ncbi:MAG: hypothetical protein HC838_13450, partial [Spirulinaceae cyanobacterium RM2_2_10]|nr:hypothetical protein [Spirulinaceae cyanobacterium RM2_2_10]
MDAEFRRSDWALVRARPLLMAAPQMLCGVAVVAVWGVSSHTALVVDSTTFGGWGVIALILSLVVGLGATRLLYRLRQELRGLRTANERLQAQFQDCQHDRDRCQLCKQEEQRRVQRWVAQSQKLPFPTYVWQACEGQLVLLDRNEAAIAQA